MVEDAAAAGLGEFEEGERPERRYVDEGGGDDLPFARGGPIFVPNLVSQLSSVPDFKASVLHELQGLNAELLSVGDFGDELSVDELKVFTEEELVEKALKHVEEDISGCEDPPLQPLHDDGVGPKDHSVLGLEIVCFNPAPEGSYLDSSGPETGSLVETCEINASNKRCAKKKGKKRGRRFDRDCRAAELDGHYFEKVKQFAAIKKKQDEDKLAAKLHSFNGKSLTLKKRKSSTLKETDFPDKVDKMRSLRFITCPSKTKSSKPQEYDPVNLSEVVLCVEIYNKENTSRKIQEFLVLGSQPLTMLKDRIYCLTDKLMEKAEKHNPSGYFLFEDTFYNDLRSPTAIDYSEPIFDWLKNCNDEAVEKWKLIFSGELKKKQKELLVDLEVSNLPKFKAADMHKTRFCDLRFRLGAGYLFCHQGNCKHIVVIRDMRLIHPEDAQNQVEYPLVTFELQPHYKKCSVCGIYHAAKMTVDDKWAPENPCYFCLNCYFLLHYNEDCSLLYPHTQYDYFHESKRDVPLL